MLCLFFTRARSWSRKTFCNESGARRQARFRVDVYLIDEIAIHSGRGSNRNMTSSQLLYAAQHRLAQHYVSRLQQASLNIQKGWANRAYWSDQVEQDWGQIQHWQAWSTSAAHQDEDVARLCVEFPLVGAELLAIRQNSADRLNWLETSLRLSENASASTKCMILRFLYRTCFHLSALDKAEPYIHQLIHLGQVSNEPAYVGCGIYALGHIAQERGSYDLAEDHYCHSLAIFSDLGGHKDEGPCLNGLGGLAAHRGQYQQAYDYFFRYLRHTQRFSQENDACVALFGLAETLISLRDFDAAERYAQQGIELCRMIGHRRVLSACLSTLGYCEFEKGHYDAALKCYEESLQIAERGVFRRCILRTLYRSGCLYSSIGQYDRALETFEQGLTLAREVKQLHFLCNILRNRANTYLALGNTAAAQQDLREALLATQHLNSAPEKSRTILSSALLHHHLGNHAQAAQWVGALFGNTYIDESMFHSLCAQLKTELDADPFNQAIEEGKKLLHDDIIAHILSGIPSES
jgi:tetratricopeptide (TPR) repeat protein